MQAEPIPVRELVLIDIDADKLAIVGGLAERMIHRSGLPIEVRLTTDRLEAIRGASYVLTQLRVGDLAARRSDELIPRQRGYIGLETTGMGGFFKALRTIPVILEIARQIVRPAPRLSSGLRLARSLHGCSPGTPANRWPGLQGCYPARAVGSPLTRMRIALYPETS